MNEKWGHRHRSDYNLNNYTKILSHLPVFIFLYYVKGMYDKISKTVEVLSYFVIGKCNVTEKNFKYFFINMRNHFDAFIKTLVTTLRVRSSKAALSVNSRWTNLIICGISG
jgi:hypothetical protein